MLQGKSVIRKPVGLLAAALVLLSQIFLLPTVFTSASGSEAWEAKGGSSPTITDAGNGKTRLEFTGAWDAGNAVMPNTYAIPVAGMTQLRFKVESGYPTSDSNDGWIAMAITWSTENALFPGNGIKLNVAPVTEDRTGAAVEVSSYTGSDGLLQKVEGLDLNQEIGVLILSDTTPGKEGGRISVWVDTGADFVKVVDYAAITGCDFLGKTFAEPPTAPTLAISTGGACTMVVDPNPWELTKAQLDKLVADATTTKEALPHAATAQWGGVSDEQYTAFSDAIAAAENAEAGAYTDAAIALNNATFTVLGQKKAQPQIETLTTAVTEANTLNGQHTVGEDLGQVSQEAKTAFTDAIAAAQAVLDAKTADQAGVDAAKTALDEAVTAFRSAIISMGDASALNAAIAQARELLVQLTPDTDTYTALEEEIASAQAIASDASSTDSVLESAQESLDHLVKETRDAISFWTVTTTASDTTGLGVTYDGSLATITLPSNASAITWQNTQIYNNTGLIPAEDGTLKFDLAIPMPQSGVWYAMTISKASPGDEGYANALNVDGLKLNIGPEGGTISASTFVDGGETGATSGDIGFEFSDGISQQFKLTLKEDNQVEVSINGTAQGTIVSEVVADLLRSEEPLCFNITSSYNMASVLKVNVAPEEYVAPILPPTVLVMDYDALNLDDHAFYLKKDITIQAFREALFVDEGYDLVFLGEDGQAITDMNQSAVLVKTIEAYYGETKVDTYTVTNYTGAYTPGGAPSGGDTDEDPQNPGQTPGNADPEEIPPTGVSVAYGVFALLGVAAVTIVACRRRK